MGKKTCKLLLLLVLLYGLVYRSIYSQLTTSKKMLGKLVGQSCEGPGRELERTAMEHGCSSASKLDQRYVDFSKLKPPHRQLLFLSCCLCY